VLHVLEHLEQHRLLFSRLLAFGMGRLTFSPGGLQLMPHGVQLCTQGVH
jgi:hypothetical protein